MTPLNASNLTYTLTTNPRNPPSPSTSTTQTDETICTDHMILTTWTSTTGWTTPSLQPYGPLTLMPTASCLHYATECFEGLKAYRGHDGALRLFRTEHNAARLQTSANRISLPLVPVDQLQRLIHALLAVDAPKWLPPETCKGEYLYIRPTLIGTQPSLGVQAPMRATLYIILGYMPRVDAVPGGMKLLTSPDDMVRSWIGGFGFAKVGANYGPSVVASQAAAQEGFHQTLWLYGEDGECTEAGGSNFFVVWVRKDGVKELVTAPLDDRLILDGVTRRSCIELVRERLVGEVEVVERKFTIGEVVEAAQEGRLVEAFSAGTACFITPVSHIRHRGQDITVPMGEHGVSGEITGKVKGWLADIMYGRTEHPWATVVAERTVA